MFKSMNDAIRDITIAIVSIILGVSCISCQKDETSPLCGTSWECQEDGSLLVFNNNHAGLYYCKSSTDDVYDEIFSSFDFIYELSGKELTIQVSFTRRLLVMDGILEGDIFTINGTQIQRHYIKIPHKLPE